MTEAVMTPVTTAPQSREVTLSAESDTTFAQVLDFPPRYEQDLRASAPEVEVDLASEFGAFTEEASDWAEATFAAASESWPED
jgi:hypothetical protein